MFTHSGREAWHMHYGCTHRERKRIINPSGNPRCVMHFHGFQEKVTFREKNTDVQTFLNIHTYIILHTYMNTSSFSKLRGKLHESCRGYGTACSTNRFTTRLQTKHFGVDITSWLHLIRLWIFLDTSLKSAQKCCQFDWC